VEEEQEEYEEEEEEGGAGGGVRPPGKVGAPQNINCSPHQLFILLV